MTCAILRASLSIRASIAKVEQALTPDRVGVIAVRLGQRRRLRIPTLEELGRGERGRDGAYSGGTPDA